MASARVHRQGMQWKWSRLLTTQKWQEFLDAHPDYEKSVPRALVFASFLYLLAKTYFHLEVRGIENIPYGKRFVWTHNHSGWPAVDSPLIGFIIARHNRVNRFHWTRDRMGVLAAVKYFFPMVGDWGIGFWNNTAINLPVLRKVLPVFHGHPVSELKNPSTIKGYPIYVTPAEGEEGSCKSSFSELYQLKRFRTGVARLAFETNAEYILPIMIVGPEESFLNIGPLRIFEKMFGSIFPFPLPVPPIPVKWVISILPPVDVKRYRSQYRRTQGITEKQAVCRKVVRILKKGIVDEMNTELCHRKPYQPWFLAGRKKGDSVNVFRYAVDGNGFKTRNGMSNHKRRHDNDIIA